jgi:hypothetical protein
MKFLSESRNYAPIQHPFTTKRGWLTRYALSCGYLHSINRGGILYQLGRPLCNCYTITAFDTKTHKSVVYEHRDVLVEARRFFSSLIRDYHV